MVRSARVKLRTATLCLPILVISVQQNAVVMTLPPFLDAQRYPVATIGTLLSLAPIFTLAARVPGGMLYRRGRTTARMAIALLVVAATSALYSLADSSALFIVVGALNGFATSIATTLYLPFFIDELPAGQARPQAMGLYTGSIALGFAIGGLGAGYAVDHWGYPAAFVAEGIVALAAIALHAAMAPAAAGAPAAALPAPGPVSARASLRNLLLPEVTSILLAALFLNVLYKIPSTFIPLYGQHAGLSLTDVGLIMAGYALSNAVVRPITGSFVARFDHATVAISGLVVQGAILMLVPSFTGVPALLAVAVAAGTCRAVVLVSNTVGMAEQMREPRFSKGMASSIFNAAGDLGYVLGPIVGGGIASITGISRLFFVAPGVICLLFFLAHAGVRLQRKQWA